MKFKGIAILQTRTFTHTHAHGHAVAETKDAKYTQANIPPRL